MKEIATLELAIARYKQGQCPQCGKEPGEPKGPQIREIEKIPNDLYCHTCKRPWPLELNADDLQDLLPFYGEHSDEEVYCADKTDSSSLRTFQEEPRTVRSAWASLKKIFRLGMVKGD